MTPEQAQYFLLMLRMGEYDEDDAFLDQLLLEQDLLVLGPQVVAENAA